MNIGLCQLKVLIFILWCYENDAIYFGEKMESIKDNNVPPIAKIIALMNQISTSLAESLYETSYVNEKGNIIRKVAL